MQARYVQIKAELTASIERGDMQPGDRVPSENALAQTYSVSRMTARRALTELVDEGILIRSQGLGTFVSDHRPMSSLLTIRSIHEDIAQRGHHHRSEVLSQRRCAASDTLSAWLGVAVGAELFYTQVLHWENHQAVQLEDRWVNPLRVPNYLDQDFSHLTTSQYLSRVLPLTQADNVVEAILPSAQQAQQLVIDRQQACLKISRRTFSAQGIVSYAVLIHPGNRYRLGGHLYF